MKKILLILSFVFVTIFFANSTLATGALLEASFSTNPTIVAPGSDGYLQLTLKNVGTTGAASIKVNQIAYGQHIAVETGGIGNIGSLGGGNSATFPFKFSVSDAAPSGIYTVRFTIDYCTESSCSGEINPVAIISVQVPSTLQVTSVEPSTLAAGETTVLNFNIANNGADTVNNIILSWQTPNNEILPLGISNKQFISSLNGKTSITIPLNVSVGSSVTPGVYPLTVRLEYFDKSGTKQNTNSTIGIKIGGTTQFDIGVQDSSSGTTSLSIANIGVNPATSVSIKIPEQQDFTVSGASSVFLGTLNAGDFGVASFQISSRSVFINRTVTNQSGGRVGNKLNVEISYSDTSGVRQVVQKEVSLNLGTVATDGSTTRNRGFLYGTTLYVLIAVVAAVIVFLVWFFKLRKRKKK